jgi:hypothetical protein
MLTNVFLDGEFWHFLNLKNMISKTHTKDFCEKNWSYIRQISKKKESFPASSQNRNGFLRLFTFISDL